MSPLPTIGPAILRVLTTRGATGIHLGIIHHIILGTTPGTTTPGTTIPGIRGTTVGTIPGTHGIGAATIHRGTTVHITTRTDGVGDMCTTTTTAIVETIAMWLTVLTPAAAVTATEAEDMLTAHAAPQADIPLLLLVAAARTMSAHADMALLRTRLAPQARVAAMSTAEVHVAQ